MPLTFDQLVGLHIEYVDGNKSCVQGPSDTAFSNHIMMSGKHYVSFECHGDGLFVGVMRPGEARQSASQNPLLPSFYEHFIQREGSLQYNNRVDCCVYDSSNGYCISRDWGGSARSDNWDGMEGLSPPSNTIGMLLDLDEGTLSVYNNGRKLGVMKRGLAGHYCWVLSLLGGSQVTIKRDTVPVS